MGIMEDKENANAWFLTNFINNVTAFVPLKNRKNPNIKLPSLEDLANNMDKVDLSFSPLSEGFNEYIINNKILLSVKTTLTQVNKSKIRNNAGEPIYQINTAPLTKIKMKK